MLQLLEHVEVEDRAVAVRQMPYHLLQHIHRHFVHIGILIGGVRKRLDRKQVPCLTEHVQRVVDDYPGEPGLE